MATKDMLLEVIIDVLKRLTDEELKILISKVNEERGERYYASLAI